MKVAKKKNKFPISPEKAEEIMKMSNEDLMKSLAAEYSDIKALEKEKKESVQIQTLSENLNGMKSKVDSMEEIQQAKAKLEEEKLNLDTLIQKFEDEIANEIREDLRALKGGFRDELKERNKRMGFMLDQLKVRFGTKGY